MIKALYTYFLDILNRGSVHSRQPKQIGKSKIKCLSFDFLKNKKNKKKDCYIL